MNNARKISKIFTEGEIFRAFDLAKDGDLPAVGFR